MKKNKVLWLLSFILIITFVATACGNKSSYSKNDEMTSTADAAPDMGEASGASYDYTMPEADKASTVSEDGGSATVTDTTELSSGNLHAESQNKIIQRYYLVIETKDFDKLMTDIDNQINSLGGYVESSQIGGKSYLVSGQVRNGNIIARIPNEKSYEFITTIKKTSNVIDNQKSTENVSIQYIDAQSRIKALEIEQERLFAILEKAEKLDSIITLESRLSDIRYELQNYESQLRTYDNQVEYSTVTLNVQEVERITPTTEVKQTFGSRIKNGFSDTVYHIGESTKNFIVWFVVNLPYLIIWGVIILIIVIIVRRYLRKRPIKTVISVPTLNLGQNNQSDNNQGENKSGENRSGELK